MAHPSAPWLVNGWLGTLWGGGWGGKRLIYVFRLVLLVIREWGLGKKPCVLAFCCLRSWSKWLFCLPEASSQCVPKLLRLQATECASFSAELPSATRLHAGHALLVLILLVVSCSEQQRGCQHPPTFCFPISIFLKLKVLGNVICLPNHQSDCISKHLL